jgi:hypothetical protein
MRGIFELNLNIVKECEEGNLSFGLTSTLSLVVWVNKPGAIMFT